MSGFVPTWMIRITFILSGSILSLTTLPSTLNNCGQRPLVAPPDESRIVGGQEATYGAWPWMVSIWIKNTHLCGGAILNNIWVLSAAHCYEKASNYSISDFHVMAGMHALSYVGIQVQKRKIRDIILHEEYDTETSDNDLMLVLLHTPLTFTDYVQPICVPDNMTHENTVSPTNCYISGWGTPVYQGTIMNTLHEAQVKLIDRRICNKDSWYDDIITENMICAGWENGLADSCQGDSGGPLQCYSKVEERFYVLGVTSFGENCGLPQRPGVYARVSMFSDWLKANQEMYPNASVANSANMGNIKILFLVVYALYYTSVIPRMGISSSKCETIVLNWKRVEEPSTGLKPVYKLTWDQNSGV